ncbi:MAG: methylase, partial [Paludibacteraceae bacterium]|nr:methylase [Paludibacteraceae bacterium]
EKGDSQVFWIELLHDVLGVDRPTEIISFENQVQLSHTSFIDAYIRSTKVLIEQKSIDKDLRKPIPQSDGTLLTPFQQAKRYSSELPLSRHPRWVVACNFRSFLIYDMEQPQGEPFEVLLDNLERDAHLLAFMVCDEREKLRHEMEVSIEAGALVGKLYDALLTQYGDEVNDADLHALNVLCVRLVFCLYAEDAGVFGKNQFAYYLTDFAPSQIRGALRDLFKVLDTPVEKRDRFLEPKLKAFPYVNGSLFREQEGEEIPPFTQETADLLIQEASLGFDWSQISPTIFGAVFESTLNPETRRSGGMHYTSIENIHKVIDPLFLGQLSDEMAQISLLANGKGKRDKLEKFQQKLASLRFLDPACGSGNFLTETYVSLRRLENKVIEQLTHGQMLLGLEEVNPIKVSIHQFYGIEINDFAVTVAKTALWIAEAQMMA